MLAACHECDALQEIRRLPPGGVALCPCCGARLYANPKGGLDAPLALSIGSLVLFLIANLSPLLSLKVAGRTQETNLSGASWALYQADMGALAAAVWVTSVLGPGLIILASLYVLSALRLDLPLPFVRPVLILISRLQPWGMMDVFMLGVLVSLVKLAGMADVVLGPGLYAFTAPIFFFAAAMARLEPHMLWERLEKLG